MRKRPDGRWEGRYTAGRNPVTGKAIYKNVLAKTQKECKEKLERAIEKNVKIDVVRSGKYTVAEWVRLWFETYSKPSIREQTAYYYNNYIEKHIVPGIGSIKLDKLTTLQIERPNWDQLRPGDIVEYKNEKSYHAVVVVRKTAEYIVVTESSTNNKTSWGGQYFRWWLEEQPHYICYTRYPQ